MVSSLARGKWIEAHPAAGCSGVTVSSLARGKWIEAKRALGYEYEEVSLPSQEGSGLKHVRCQAGKSTLTSSLARGKWIEAYKNYVL